jgi:DNA-binding beta-propeller fold protein YncE
MNGAKVNSVTLQSDQTVLSDLTAQEKIRRELQAYKSRSLVVVRTAGLLIGLVGSSPAPSLADEPLRFVEAIPLPRVEGRIDHMAIDDDGERLFVTALGKNTLEAIDLASKKVLQPIKNLDAPQGVCIAPALKRIAVANDKDGSVRLYDVDSLEQRGVVDLKDAADNVRYDPATGRFWVGYGQGGLAAIDAQTGEQVANIPLDGHPESFQLDASDKRIFVNIPTASQVAVIDRERAAVITKWPIKRGVANFPMALDAKHHRLFLGCRKPAQLLVLDTTTGQTIKSLSAVGDADDVFYDGAAGRIYVSGGEGRVTVISQKDADTYELMGSISTGAGARTSIFDATCKLLYVAVPHRGNQTAEIRVFNAE